MSIINLADQVKVVFHEPNTRWEAEGVFSASDVYEQVNQHRTDKADTISLYSNEIS